MIVDWSAMARGLRDVGAVLVIVDWSAMARGLRDVGAVLVLHIAAR